MSTRLRIQDNSPLRLDPAKLVMVVRPGLARREMVISLPVAIDICNAARVSAEELIMAVSRHPVVIIDISATTFCDCAGARAVVRAYKHRSRSARRRVAPGGDYAAGAAGRQPAGDRSSP